MALGKAESRVYEAGLAIQANLPLRQGVLLKDLVASTEYGLGAVHKAVEGLIKKRHAHWPMKDKNRRKGALRFWQVKS